MTLSHLAIMIAVVLATSSLTGCNGGNESQDSSATSTAVTTTTNAVNTTTPTSNNTSTTTTNTATTTAPIQSALPTVLVLDAAGEVFTSQTGLSLYFFDKDTAGVSNCLGKLDDSSSCIAKWPPLLATADTQVSGNFSLIKRDDGTLHWAWKGRALYSFSGDQTLGDTKGDGLAGVWHLARRAPFALSSAAVPAYQAKAVVWSQQEVSGQLQGRRWNKEAFSLYLFDNDPIDSSSCVSACLNAWPPLLADAGSIATEPLSLISRGSGNKQWAYLGKPLYLYAKDALAGETKGESMAGWHLASKLPALSRTVDNVARLTSTGKAQTLVPTDASNSSFTVQWLDKDQFSLYRFDKDTELTSNCSGACLAKWPPFLAADTAVAVGDFAILTRADGYKQWAWQGKPLYFFSGDSSKGQSNGNGVGGLWHLVP
jgi:predicted lipoprotein with Yx(FWY)xxD motif